MDAFFASVEQRDRPELRGLPIAVGGASARGVVTTASYEARPFGVRSAMPGSRARRLCPDLVFVEPRFDVYRAVSREIREIFARHAAAVEPLSLDEAYLDVTDPPGGARPAVEIARDIRAEIREKTGLTASAGVSFNKFLAKLASDMRKPDGLMVIRPGEAHAIIAALPIERFFGIGPVTARRMHAHGIRTGADLQALDLPRLTELFGRSGQRYWQLARGIDEREVEPERERKSVSVETTFARDLRDLHQIAEAIDALSIKLGERLHRSDFAGRTVTLKLKYADFRLRTRSTSFARPVRDPGLLARIGRGLLLREHLDNAVRLVGLGVGGQDGEEGGSQLELPLDPAGQGQG